MLADCSETAAFIAGIVTGAALTAAGSLIRTFVYRLNTQDLDDR